MKKDNANIEEYTVVYFNMPVGATYNDNSYINKYDSLCEKDKVWRIPYLKVGQTTYIKNKHKSVYDAVRENRGGDKTGYPVTMSTIAYVVFPCKLRNVDKRVRQLIHSLTDSFDESAEESNYGKSSDYNRHPENEDIRFISAGTEFIYNITKSVIVKTINALNGLIELGDKGINFAKILVDDNATFISRLEEINENIKNAINNNCNVIEIAKSVKSQKKEQSAILAFDVDELDNIILFKKYKTYVNSVAYDYILTENIKRFNIYKFIKYFQNATLYQNEIRLRSHNEKDYAIIYDCMIKNANLINDYYSNMIYDMKRISRIELCRKYNITL